MWLHNVLQLEAFIEAVKGVERVLEGLMEVIGRVSWCGLAIKAKGLFGFGLG